jgi:hypothetical protein
MRSIFLVVACAAVVALLSGALCTMVQGSGIAGEAVYAFLLGMIAVASGGTVVGMGGTWVVDRFSRLQERRNSCL